jgi:predicted DNA-binding transcriptional regulator YafY
VSFKNSGLGKADLAVFNALSSAVLRQHEVEFDYRKPGESKGGSRRVQPYHLSHRENLWYLIGRDMTKNALRTFAVPRIREVRTSPKTFARPEDFSPEQFFANALGVLGGSGNYRVKIRFSAEVADRVRERVWHDTQEMRDVKGGALELTLVLGALPEVESWILGWGEHAEVLEPPELRTKIAATASALAARYTRK